MAIMRTPPSSTRLVLVAVSAAVFAACAPAPAPTPVPRKAIAAILATSKCLPPAATGSLAANFYQLRVHLDLLPVLHALRGIETLLGALAVADRRAAQAGRPPLAEDVSTLDALLGADAAGALAPAVRDLPFKLSPGTGTGEVSLRLRTDAPRDALTFEYAVERGAEASTFAVRHVRGEMQGFTVDFPALTLRIVVGAEAATPEAGALAMGTWRFDEPGEVRTDGTRRLRVDRLDLPAHFPPATTPTLDLPPWDARPPQTAPPSASPSRSPSPRVAGLFDEPTPHELIHDAACTKIADDVVTTSSGKTFRFVD
jgi:hypothetical protein